jgi:tetratricopeptide (TPR) repeat protein
MQPAQRNMTHAIALCLGLITLLLFLPVNQFEFVNYDDDLHVTNNPAVLQGLTWEGIVWAFTGSAEIFWHPVTWLSHMLDVTLFGLNPAGHHLMSVIIHLLAAIVLFYALLELTERAWPSALVAAWFAWHPLHVESVAWVSERKDVLSGLFFSLTLFAYARYARGQNRRWYWAAFAAFALGLMSKTMLVTLPVILLLLDVWPLKRVAITGKLDQATWRKLLLEKWPYAALVIVAVLLTIVPAAQASVLRSEDQWDLTFRLKNSVVAIMRYLELTVYPAKLSVYYPPADIPLMQALIAGILILGLLVWSILQRSKSPWWAVAWWWFLIMLLPVLGLIKVGTHAFADRYTYLPLIGIFIGVAFGADHWSGQNQSRRRMFASIAVATLLACIGLTRQQLMVWKNSITLFEQALKATKDNPIAHYNLASALVAQNRVEEALPHYEAVLKLRPNREDVHFHMGLTLVKLQNFQAARSHFATAVELNPANSEARMNLGNILYLDGKSDEAIEQFRQVLRLKPDHDGVRNNLGLILMEQNRLPEAEASFRQALQVRPDNTEAHFNLGRVLVKQGQVEEGYKHLLQSVQLAPTSPMASLHLAWLLATHPDARYRRGTDAVRLATQALQLTGGNDAPTLDALAAAYAEAGQFDLAIKTARQASLLAQSASATALVEALNLRLKQYEKGQAWRQQP